MWGAFNAYLSVFIAQKILVYISSRNLFHVIQHFNNFDKHFLSSGTNCCTGVEELEEGPPWPGYGRHTPAHPITSCSTKARGYFYIVYTVRCYLYCVKNTFYTLHCVVYTVSCTSNTLLSSLYTVDCLQYTV